MLGHAGAVENKLCGIHGAKTAAEVVVKAKRIKKIEKGEKVWRPNPCTALEYDELYGAWSLPFHPSAVSRATGRGRDGMAASTSPGWVHLEVCIAWPESSALGSSLVYVATRSNQSNHFTPSLRVS